MTCLRLRSVVVVALLLACGSLALPAAARADDQPRDDVRREARCSRSSEITLRLRAHDGEIRIELEIDPTRRRSSWATIVLHERRIVFRGALRARDDSVRLRRVVPDFFGSDTVVARATGPRGETCRISAGI